jgi:hypothetical protein
MIYILINIFNQLINNKFYLNTKIISDTFGLKAIMANTFYFLIEKSKIYINKKEKKFCYLHLFNIDLFVIINIIKLIKLHPNFILLLISLILLLYLFIKSILNL